jgi:UDP-2,3-diacylglucosamine pyrophosphatase LpxH
MRYVITSDLHLGSPHSRRESFLQFLEALPDGTELVLNGDTVDDPTQPLPGADLEVVERLHDAARRLSVVLVEGNHDQGSRVPGLAGLSFRAAHTIGQQLYSAHGDYFDNVLPRYRWFVRLFLRLHQLRVRLGARPVHVAQYAKHWAPLYLLLRRSVMLNAVEFARERGFAAVACGHVHFPEEQTLSGIRYFNTGSWTETRFWYVLADHAGAQLLEYRPGEPVGVGT